MMVRSARSITITMIVVLSCTLALSSSCIMQGGAVEDEMVLAMGGEVEVKKFYFPGLTIEIDEIVEDYEEKDFKLEGELGYYQIIRLVEERGETYHFRIKAGGGMHSQIEYHVIGDVISEGEHNLEDNYSREKREMTGSGQIHITHDLFVDAIFYKENLTLHSADLTSRWDYRGEFQGTNVSFLESDGQNISLYYEDIDITLNGNKMLSLYFEFHEALDVFHLDLEGEANITTAAYASLEGMYGGVLNIRGLPELEEQKLLDTYDSTEFPIYWEDRDIDLEGAHDGIIEPTEVQVQLQLNVSSEETMILEDGREYDVRPSNFHFEIVGVEEITSIYGKWWYSPDRGFIVAQEIGSTHTRDNLFYVTDSDSITMMPVTEEVAEERMKELQHIPPLSTVEALFRAPIVYVIMGILLAVGLIVYYKKYLKKTKDK